MTSTDLPDLERELADWLFPDGEPVDAIIASADNARTLRAQGYDPHADLVDLTAFQLARTRDSNQSDPAVIADIYWARLGRNVSENEIRNRILGIYGREGFIGGVTTDEPMRMQKSETKLSVIVTCTPLHGGPVDKVYITVRK